MDIYFAGSGYKESTEEIRKLGANQLLSQLNEKKKILEWVEYFKENPDCKSKLFIDSGAYSAHTKGVEVDVDAYIKFMNEIDDYITVYAQVDKIPGRFGQPRTEEDLLNAPRESWENYLYMAERAKSPHKLIPVFHQGESFKWLENMLEYRDANGKPIEYIGISSAKDQSVKSNESWLKQVWSTIKSSSNPNVKTHGFGIMILRILKQFPFTSSDSTSWIQAGANGGIFYRDKNGEGDHTTLLISDQQLDHKDNYFNMSEAGQKNVREFVGRYGMTPEELSKDNKARMIYHVRYLKDWENNYEYTGSNYHVKKLINLNKGGNIC